MSPSFDQLNGLIFYLEGVHQQFLQITKLNPLPDLKPIRSVSIQKIQIRVKSHLRVLAHTKHGDFLLCMFSSISKESLHTEQAQPCRLIRNWKVSDRERSEQTKLDTWWIMFWSSNSPSWIVCICWGARWDMSLFQLLSLSWVSFNHFPQFH
jgi:hypothetical protein